MTDLPRLLAQLTEAHAIDMGLSFRRSFTDAELAEARAQLAIAQAQVSAQGQEIFDQFINEGMR